MANSRDIGSIPALSESPDASDALPVWDDSAGVLKSRAYRDFIADVAAYAGVPRGIFLDDLPTVDPEVAGQIWNDDGTPTVSEG